MAHVSQSLQCYPFNSRLVPPLLMSFPTLLLLDTTRLSYKQCSPLIMHTCSAMDASAIAIVAQFYGAVLQIPTWPWIKQSSLCL